MLAKGRNAGEIIEYIQNMQMFMDNPYEYVKSGNKDVDSLLNYLLNQAEEILDKVEYKINVPREMNIKSFDFNIIMTIKGVFSRLPAVNSIKELGLLWRQWRKQAGCILPACFQQGV